MADKAPEWLSRTEAARIAGVHFNTVRDWEATGKLHPKRTTIGSRERILISRKELEAVIEERGERLSLLPGAGREQITQAREKIARLEAEHEMLTAQLEELKAEKERLLTRILENHEPRR